MWSLRTVRSLTLALAALVLLCPCVPGSDNAPTAPDRPDAFAFVVMGDNRPNRGSPDRTTQPRQFTRAVEEINALDPDFVIICGDLIYGYTGDEELLNRMWDGYDAAVARFKVPVYQVIGNHDVSNRVMQRVYLGRYGDRFPLFYSFSHKQCHYVVLDSDLHGEYNHVKGEQIEWLKKDLERHQDARMTFVFLHKPLWQFGDASNWMSDVHPLLARYGVHTVFASHQHVFTKCDEVDAVRYVITGGAGAEIRRSDMAGGFHHYCVVTVRGDNVSLAVVRTGHVEDESIVTEDMVRKVGLVARALSPVRLRVARGTASVPAEFDVVVPNPFDEELTGTLLWHVPEGSPLRIQDREVAVAVAPGEEQVLTVRMPDEVPVADLEDREGFPVAEWNLSVGGRTLCENTRASLAIDRWPYAPVRSALRRMAAMSEVETLTAAEGLSTSVRLPVRNPSDWDMRCVMQWRLPGDCRWKVAPGSQTVQLAAGQVGAVQFEVAFEGQAAEVFPLPRLRSVVKLDGEEVLQTSARLPVDARQLIAKATSAVQCVQTKAPPVIDGKLDDELWGKCPAASNFVLLTGKGRSDYPTEARFAYDSENLYVGFRCREPRLAGLVTGTTERDGPTYDDDSVELFLDTNLDRNTYYQYAINANGVVYDGFGFDGAWDGPCLVKAGRESDAWVIELAVPWKTLEMEAPEPGTRLGLEIARTRLQGGGEVSQWAPTLNGRNHAPEHFGVLILE